MSAMPLISIVICTLRRPKHLLQALDACLSLRSPGACEVEILVVDNSLEASARDLVLGAAANAPIPIRFVHEPRTSIAHARNTGVAASHAPLIAFIDDDMRPSSAWLVQVMRGMELEKADALIGAIEPVPEEEGQEADPRLLDMYRRDLRLPEGSSLPVRKNGYISGVGTGNSVLRRATCVDGVECFDPAFGRTGGEDTDFFQRLGRRRLKIVWSAQALAYEIVSPRRATLDYAIYSAFHGSQNFARVTIKNSRHRLRTRMALAAVGAAQGSARLCQYALLRLVRSDEASYAQLSAAAALGKIPWLPDQRPWWETPR